MELPFSRLMNSEVGEFAEPDGLAPGERMLRPNDCRELIRVIGNHRQLRRLDVPAENSDIRPVFPRPTG